MKKYWSQILLGLVVLVLLVVSLRQHRLLKQMITPLPAASAEIASPVVEIPARAAMPSAEPAVRPVAPRPAEPVATVVPVVTPPEVDPKPPAPSLVEMMKQPEFREVFRAQQKMMMEQTYGELFDALELEGEDRETMKQLLGDRAAAMMDLGMEAMSQPGSPEVAEENNRNMKAAMDAFDEDMKTFLGEEDFDLYKQFEDTKGERMQVDLYKQALNSSDQLEWEQEHELILAMHEERKAFKFSTTLGDEQALGAGFPGAEQMRAHAEDMRRLQERYIDRAADILTPNQLDQFKASQDQVAAMQEMSFKMAEKMFGNRAAPAAPEPKAGPE